MAGGDRSAGGGGVSPPGAQRPRRSSAERPAPEQRADVFVRDFDGGGARRIPRALAERLVAAGIAEQVSATGHVRLRLGIRGIQTLPNGERISGIPAVELSRFYRGDSATRRAVQHLDRRQHSREHKGRPL